LDTEIRKQPYGLREEMIQRLVCNYGSSYPLVLQYLDQHAKDNQTVKEDLSILKAEVLHGIRDEMARKLSDVVFRRTELGTVGHPGDESLRFCAGIMGGELGWSPVRIEKEIQEVSEVFPAI
jgi:glycerol-3-phosphate dehydrogenase